MQHPIFDPIDDDQPAINAKRTLCPTVIQGRSYHLTRYPHLPAALPSFHNQQQNQQVTALQSFTTSTRFDFSNISPIEQQEEESTNINTISRHSHDTTLAHVTTLTTCLSRLLRNRHHPQALPIHHRTTFSKQPRCRSQTAQMSSLIHISHNKNVSRDKPNFTSEKQQTSRCTPTIYYLKLWKKRT